MVGALVLSPGPPQLVYVGVANNLYLSRDKGKNWNVIAKFKQRVVSVLVTPNGLRVGLGWSLDEKTVVRAAQGSSGGGLGRAGACR